LEGLEATTIDIDWMMVVFKFQAHPLIPTTLQQLQLHEFGKFLLYTLKQMYIVVMKLYRYGHNVCFSNINIIVILIYF
jgi:hypothetical protein